MGKIITIVAAVDFPGGAFTGVNLSVSLHRQSKADIAFVDFGLQRVDELSTILGNASAKSVFDLLPLIAGNAPDLIKGYLQALMPGVTVIGSADVNGTRPLEPADVRDVVRFISCSYPYMVTAAPVEQDERQLSLLGISDMVILMTAPDLLSLRKARQFIERLQAWHLPLDLIHPTLVQIKGVTSYLSREEAVRVLGIAAPHSLTIEPQLIITSVNSGVIPVNGASLSDFSKDMVSLASFLSNDASYPIVNKASLNRDEQTGASICENTGISVRGIKETIHRAVIDALHTDPAGDPSCTAEAKAQQVRHRAKRIIEELLSKESALRRDERSRILQEMLDEILGLGCLEEYLNDPEITEIMVNGPETVYVETRGKIHLTSSRFSSAAQLLTVIERIVSPLGRRVDESSPLVDARLADGSRVNVVIPPVSLVGPVLTVRKFSTNKLSADDLMAAGALVPSMVQFLKACVQLRKNIIISGGTGSGKTTLLNVLSSFIPADERIVTIEDSAELRLPQEHVVRLESRRASVEGTGEVSIRHLVTNALRMRPDRIIIGECRSGETLDMLQAMNTGHDGSITTVHANSPRDAVARVATMALMAGTELPERAIREQICSAIHIIVQLSRVSDGSRKILEITEVSGSRDGHIELFPLFKFTQKGINDGKVLGDFAATGIAPSFLNNAESYGIAFDKSIFKNTK